MFNRFCSKNKGFTLVELLIAMSIFIIVSLVGADYIINGFRAIDQESKSAASTKNMRRTMDIMINEIRGANSSERGDYALSVIDPSEFIFYNDVSGDSKRERVRYYISEDDLYREIISADSQNNYNSSPLVSVLVHNLFSGDVFSYYDQAGQVTSLINNVRMVKIVLAMPSANQEPVGLESSVSLRNLKNN